MTTVMNASKAEQTLRKNLKDDSVILKAVGAVCKFASGVAVGDPFTLAKGIADLTEAASSAIDGSSALISRLGGDHEEKKDLKSPYDRFCLLFFVTCQRCYIEAIQQYIAHISHAESRKLSEEEKTIEHNRLKERLEIALANLNEADAPFRFGADPMTVDIPLFKAFDTWLAAALEYLGYAPSSLEKPVTSCGKDAKQRFRVWVAQDTAEAKWVRNYLAIAGEEHAQGNQSIGDLTTLHEVLMPWVEQAKKNEQKRSAMWSGYRNNLMLLPDQKESMFNEQFGVRNVFVSPLATYHIAGAHGELGTPVKISDLGRVLGALLSTRVKGDDLIILCGGPGSGKSTLCRMLASKLASDARVYPVFVRLRRLKEGAEIAAFIDELLKKEGLIDRTADIKEIPNLIIILDGFDELVMASRTRLRQFFNALREDHASGILRNAKVVVSGRDTLFPRGEGLPSGSHVLGLIPFDRSRVTLWGEKWRALESAGKSSTFHPEHLLPNDLEKNAKKSPLHHLLTWPLTLHLIARVHTSGRLTVNKDKCDEIERAYLYRSILVDTATRQLDQAEGKGRLDSKQMRKFLQALAWQMHTRSVDCMDVADVMPILKQFFPSSTDGDLADLAEVAIVNSPELTKGEETGFEFVHKSFAEYLAAEHMALAIEQATYMIDDAVTDERAWRMSDRDAAGSLAQVFGERLLTDEVQEMLDPMLGGFKSFLAGERVSERSDVKQREDGLTRIVVRFESLLRDGLHGKLMDAVAETLKGKGLNPLEAYANFCAGLVLVGSASARARTVITEDKKLFNINPFENAFWRLISVLVAGGLTLDEQMSARLFEGTVTPKSQAGNPMGDISIPFKLGSFRRISGYENRVEKLIVRLFEQVYIEMLAALVADLPPPHRDFRSHELRHLGRRSIHNVGQLLTPLTELGLLPERSAQNLHSMMRDVLETKEGISLRAGNRRIAPEELLYRLEHNLRRFSSHDSVSELQFMLVELQQMYANERGPRNTKTPKK